jgi:uncharacterized membrane protein
VTDTKLEQIVGKLLQVGVTAAAVVVLAGGAWYLFEDGGALASYSRFHPEPHALRTLSTMARPRALMLLGLLLLIATPVARVVFSLAAFVLERDRVYVALTAAVLCVLLYSIATAWW